jgi:uncharacterized protein (DUF952 family)
MTIHTIYKIVSEEEWRSAEARGLFEGSDVDRRDGYIHFSTHEQAGETADRHFAGKEDLLLVAIDATQFGASLKWEPSRGGALFPHLYSPLDLKCVKWTAPLPLDSSGRHVFPQLEM